MAKPRPIPGLDADEPFGAAAVRVVGVRADELWTMAEQVRMSGDATAVHDMRVATRRLRAALEVFAACFPGKRHRAVLRDVKSLADALGTRRDADVQLERLAPLEAAFGRQEQAGLAALSGAIAAEREAAGATVEAALTAAERSDLHGRIEELLRNVKA